MRNKIRCACGKDDGGLLFPLSVPQGMKSFSYPEWLILFRLSSCLADHTRIDMRYIVEISCHCCPRSMVDKKYVHAKQIIILKSCKWSKQKLELIGFHFTELTEAIQPENWYNLAMKSESEQHARRMGKFIHEVSIYPVSCERLAAGRTDVEWLAAVLEGGARIVQLRDKESDDRALYEKAIAFRRQTAAAGALFIVNNRVDIAMLAGADGVHLGNRDLPAEEVRKMCPDLIIGVSCHTEDEAATAAGRGASYFNIGPLFSTETKGGLSQFLGPAAIPRFAARSDLPFTVMGGIKLHHIPELIGLGATRIAVVTALTQAADIARETEKWRRLMEKDRPTPA